VWTHDDRSVAAVASVDLDRWRTEFEELMARIAPRFARVEPRRHARELLLGLMAELPRVNCWTLAEHSGHASPDRLQHLLARAKWNADGVRDDLRDYVVEQLSDPGAVLVVDETGDLKKGHATVGVQRQYTGTAGRIENSQVAVYLVYAACGGCAFLDRALYLPKCWTDDPQRMAAAGVPDGIGFATKPTLARELIGRALDAGVPAAWAAGDEVYGADPGLRAECEERGLGYVLAVARHHRVRTGIGTRRAIDLAVRLPTYAWRRISAGRGARGERFYDWALVDLKHTRPGSHGLLIRRNRTTGELAFYRVWSPRPVTVTEIVRVAGTRWNVEEDFQTGKELAALDEHQVRRWTSWQRWTVLAMLAHTFLTVITARQTPPPLRRDSPSSPTPPPALIPLTRNEVRHLFVQLSQRIHASSAFLLRWSIWRRHHQAVARAAHYHRQARSQ
jgi:SRSO17 transposase